MRELLPQIETWFASEKQVALATLVKAWGSAPRPLGSIMAISSAGEIAGSVSGGCVEGAVTEEALAVLASGAPRLVAYGISDDTAWSVGLSCGGQVEIFIEALVESDPVHRHLVERLSADLPTVRAVVVDGSPAGAQLLLAPEGAITGSLGNGEFDDQVAASARECVDRLASGRRRFHAAETQVDVFLGTHMPRSQLIIVGAVHVAIHLVALARRLGFSTIVIDPRTAFATAERFSEADRLISDWPKEALAEIPLHATTCFVFLSHDLKIDLPGLEIALESPALYVGALGSKKTHAKRVQALRDLGFDDEKIARVSAPIGLDLGGRRAEEIALSIMAEIVAVSYGKA